MRYLRGKRRPGLYTKEESEYEDPVGGIEPCMALGYRAVKAAKAMTTGRTVSYQRVTTPAMPVNRKKRGNL